MQPMKPASLLPIVIAICSFTSIRAADWPQLQGDARRSGNTPGEILKKPLGLLAAVPLTDSVQAAPVGVDGGVLIHYQHLFIFEHWRVGNGFK